MFIELDEEQHAMQLELREYFTGISKQFDITPETVNRARHGVSPKEIFQQLGRDGWLGVGWPVEYGGKGKGPIDQLIFLEEAAAAGVPVPMLTLNTVGPTIAEFGTQEQKDYFLPRILSGDVEIAVGYSEPHAGTDFASLKTRAVRDGDHYVVNGQKIWTTSSNNADFIWLACRTDPDAAKHKGISLLLVDTTLPGFSWTPISLIGGGHTTATYYQDIRVPVSMRVGEENDGWRMFTSQINRERVALAPSAEMFRTLNTVVEWAQSTTRSDGTRVADVDWIAMTLGRMRAKIEVARLFNWRMAWHTEMGNINPAEASVMKVYVTELEGELQRALLNVVGAEGIVPVGSKGAVLDGLLEQGYRGPALINTFGGGTNEIQREIIATAGLHTPRAPR